LECKKFSSAFFVFKPHVLKKKCNWTNLSFDSILFVDVIYGWQASTGENVVRDGEIRPALNLN